MGLHLYVQSITITYVSLICIVVCKQYKQSRMDTKSIQFIMLQKVWIQFYWLSKILVRFQEVRTWKIMSIQEL